IASGSDDDTIIIRNVATGEEQHTLRGHSPAVSSVAFSPDGFRLASRSRSDGTVEIWDMTTGEEQCLLL
ncbi:WD40-repeat-containing domain protein, partial [Mycena galericulata]